MISAWKSTAHLEQTIQNTVFLLPNQMIAQNFLGMKFSFPLMERFALQMSLQLLEKIVDHQLI